MTWIIRAPESEYLGKGGDDFTSPMIIIRRYFTDLHNKQVDGIGKEQDGMHRVFDWWVPKSWLHKVTRKPAINKEDLVEAFNQWMNDYTNHPEKYEHDWQIVEQFLSDTRDGIPPSYGERSAALIFRLAGIE